MQIACEEIKDLTETRRALHLEGSGDFGGESSKASLDVILGANWYGETVPVIE